MEINMKNNIYNSLSGHMLCYGTGGQARVESRKINRKKLKEFGNMKDSQREKFGTDPSNNHMLSGR